MADDMRNHKVCIGKILRGRFKWSK